MHCQKRDFEAKKRSVLSKILIGFPENPLELDEIGGDSRTRIFTAFSMRKVQKTLKTRHFRGSRICRYLPSNSAKFGFCHLTRNQLYLTVPWVRIPPTPPSGSRINQVFMRLFHIPITFTVGTKFLPFCYFRNIVITIFRITRP